MSGKEMNNCPWCDAPFDTAPPGVPDSVRLDAEWILNNWDAFDRQWIKERVFNLARYVVDYPAPAPAVGLDDARKALLAAKRFIENGVEFGYIRMPEADTLDSAHEVMPLIRAALSTLPERDK